MLIMRDEGLLVLISGDANGPVVTKRAQTVKKLYVKDGRITDVSANNR